MKYHKRSLIIAFRYLDELLKREMLLVRCLGEPPEEPQNKNPKFKLEFYAISA